MARKKLTSVARKLRRASTDAETRLWSHVRGRQLENAKFVRQLQIGSFVADFACRDAHLAIELDGGQHDAAVDAPRSRVIETFGYRVMRFWNHDVLQDTEVPLEAVRHELLIARNRPE